jgi:hypothetical protein
VVPMIFTERDHHGLWQFETASEFLRGSTPGQPHRHKVSGSQDSTRRTGSGQIVVNTRLKSMCILTTELSVNRIIMRFKNYRSVAEKSKRLSK